MVNIFVKFWKITKTKLTEINPVILDVIELRLILPLSVSVQSFESSLNQCANSDIIPLHNLKSNSLPKIGSREDHEAILNVRLT